MYLVAGCSEPIIRSESTQKINKNQEKKLNTKNLIFSKPMKMFYHPVDR